MAAERALGPVRRALPRAMIAIAVAAGLLLAASNLTRRGGDDGRVAEPAARVPTVATDRGPVRSVGALPRPSAVTIGNGIARVSLRPRTGNQRAGHEYEVRRGGAWVEATDSRYGDWTYVGASVITPPTSIEVSELTTGRVAVSWTFDDHVIPARLTADGRPRRYPFAKTVWLRAGDAGYYTLIEPRPRLPRDAGELEHEVGFGGVYGPAALRHPGGVVRTEHNERHWTLTTPWVQLAFDGMTFSRTLVAFPASELLSPVWGGARFGGIYVHRLEGGPWGAYLLAADGSGLEICIAAWANAPAKLSGLATHPSCVSR